VTAQELKNIMHNHGLTAKDVAQICYVSDNAVYSWRIGRKKMSPAHVALLKMRMDNDK